MRKIIRILFLVTMLITVSCNSKKVENNIVEVPKESKVIKVDKTGTFEYELNNLNGEDVYFIFTNESDDSISSPTITKVDSALNPSIIGKVNSQAIVRNMTKTSNNIVLSGMPQMGSPIITESNRELGEKLKKSPKFNGINRNVSETQKSIAEGTKEYFFGGKGETVLATLRKVQSAHGKTLYMWVADDSWSNDSTKATKVEQSMINTLADKFLKVGTGDDIYEWVSNIVGEPWGTTQYIDLIGNDGSIHILLYDIDNNNSVTGGICGYYSAKHNFKKSAGSDFTTSNEKLMFAIDSVMFAKAEGDVWEISDFWPQFMVSTLAHEFQHMINWYQKIVLRETPSNAWVNELASMAIEDLLARKILADGPRGVNYNTATSGSSGNIYGRIPIYNYYNEKKVTDWTQDDESYGMSYTFGAYLMRNYGGSNFIKNLVKNSKDSKESVTEALKLSGYSNLTFNDVLRNFAVANLLSDSTNNELGYRFNRNTWETSTINGINYDLGAINLYNYIRQPYIYDDMPSELNGVSNTYYNAGKALTGNKKWKITGLDSNVKITVITKK